MALSAFTAGLRRAIHCGAVFARETRLEADDIGRHVVNTDADWANKDALNENADDDAARAWV